MHSYDHEIRLNGKVYKCEHRNGIRYIDGKTSDEFIKDLDPITLFELAVIGRQWLTDIVTGIGLKEVSYQRMADEFHAKKNN
jgi:hypothetical protein